MAYLLDTNAISEINKLEPNAGFIQWFGQVLTFDLYASCITFGEIYKGIELLPDTPKRQLLESRTIEILNAFESRILTVELDAALIWAKLIATGTQKGRPAPSIDALIAAQCIQHRLTLITRNIKDFEQFAGLKVLCPWTE